MLFSDILDRFAQGRTKGVDDPGSWGNEDDGPLLSFSRYEDMLVEGASAGAFRWLKIAFCCLFFALGGMLPCKGSLLVASDRLGSRYFQCVWSVSVFMHMVPAWSCVWMFHVLACAGTWFWTVELCNFVVMVMKFGFIVVENLKPVDPTLVCATLCDRKVIGKSLFFLP
jgi:hypothetical protein